MGVSDLRQIDTWTERLGSSKLRCYTDKNGHFWLEQNSSKPSKWGKLAQQGHQIAWEFHAPGGAYTGRLIVDGQIYTTAEATRLFLKGAS